MEIFQSERTGISSGSFWVSVNLSFCRSDDLQLQNPGLFKNTSKYQEQDIDGKIRFEKVLQLTQAPKEV